MAHLVSSTSVSCCTVTEKSCRCRGVMKEPMIRRWNECRSPEGRPSSVSFVHTRTHARAHTCAHRGTAHNSAVSDAALVHVLVNVNLQTCAVQQHCQVRRKGWLGCGACVSLFEGSCYSLAMQHRHPRRLFQAQVPDRGTGHRSAEAQSAEAQGHITTSMTWLVEQHTGNCARVQQQTQPIGP